jgi:hypothetical protein
LVLKMSDVCPFCTVPDGDVMGENTCHRMIRVDVTGEKRAARAEGGDGSGVCSDKLIQRHKRQ